MAAFTKRKGTIIIPISLGGNKTTILAFGHEEKARQHLNRISPNVLQVEYRDNSVLLSLSPADTTEVTLSDGRALSLNATRVPPEFTLTNWTLQAEHWEAPDNLKDIHATVKYNKTFELGELTSWTNIPSLVNASGVGYYTTTIDWPPKEVCFGSTLGAFLSLGDLLDGASVSVNGEFLDRAGLAHSVVDISTHLVRGKNTVEVVVPTPMWNYLRTIIADLRTAGSVPLPVTLEELLGLPLEGRTEAGLLGPVKVVPVKRLEVRLY